MITTAVFDIDGTLALMDKATQSYQALEGAIAALEACAVAGIDVWAYTNGTFFPPALYYPRLAQAGLVLKAGRVITPATVAAHVLRERGHRRVMILGAEGTVLPMREAGFEVVPAEADTGAVDAVLIGWVPDLTLARIEALVRAVWAGAQPYSVSDAPYFAGAKGRLLGVSGSVGAIIAHACGVTPVVLGKPSTIGLEMVARAAGVVPAQIAVIGDDPTLEIRMARLAGARAIGVTTGISGPDDFNAADPAHRAQRVMTDLSQLLTEDWLNHTIV